MNKTSTQTVHKSEAQVQRTSSSELDRVAALPPGKGDKGNPPALTLDQIAAAASPGETVAC